MMTPAIRQAYGALLRKKVPFVIRSRKEYETRRAEARELMMADRTRAESEYLNLLTMLIELYERENVKLPASSPLEVLHELMSARRMVQADLAMFAGSSGTASEVYNGKRRISVGLAKKLADHFNVSFAVFL